MLPVIFSVGPVTLYSIALVLFVTLFAFMFVVWKRGREVYFEEEELFDSVFYIVFIFLITARIGYLLVNASDFGWNVWGWVNIVGRPGLLYITGILGGIGAVVWKAKQYKWEVLALSDVLVVALSLALSIISLGMFLNGSSYGKPTTSFLGIQFPGLYDKRIPVQLFEMVLYAFLFVFLWWLEARYRTFGWYKGKRSEASSGFITACFFIGHGLIGLIMAWLREGTLVIFGHALDWVFYLAMLLFGAWLLVRRSDLSFFGKFEKKQDRNQRLMGELGMKK